jgi:DNA-directed RNA polymerase subunit K/omega
LLERPFDAISGQAMQVFTPSDLTKHAANKYLGVLIAAKFARLLNEFPRDRSGKEKKLTSRALDALSSGGIEYRVTPRKRVAE